jgi:hypothetical protein
MIVMQKSPAEYIPTCCSSASAIVYLPRRHRRLKAMNKTILALLLLASIGNITANAQSQTTRAAAEPQAKAVAVPFIILPGTLAKGLNSKSASASQTFVVKTDQALKLTDGTVIPADSDVTGHVLQAAARANGAQESTLTLTFDTLKPKGSEKALPIRGIIQAIAGPAPASVAAPPAGDMRTESVGGGVTGARISSDQLHSEAAVGGTQGELNERSSGVIGIKNMTLTAAPLNGVDGSMLYSADKSVKLEDGSRVMLRIALKP